MPSLKEIAPNTAMILWANQIREYAEENNDWFTARDIQKLINYSSTSTRIYLNFLVQEGCLESKTDKWRKFYRLKRGSKE